MIRLYINAKVNNADIRHFLHNGRPHIAIPSYTLPDEIVMNGGLYTHDEIEKSYKGLEGTPAPIGHPVVNGKPVLATTMEALHTNHVGAFNKNVERSGDRIYIEKWIDVEFAEKFELGKELLKNIADGAPIHTSVAAMARRELISNQAGYTWIARDMKMDHDAILFGEPGAATPEQGVGMLVNSADTAVVCTVPELIVNGLLKKSYRQKDASISQALREKFSGGDKYAYVEDFDDKTVVFNTQDGMMAVTYEMDGDNAILGDLPEAVKIKREFVARGAEVRTDLALVKNAVQCDPVHEKPIKSLEADAVDKNELTELLANAVKPLSDKIDAQDKLIAGLSTQLTANANAAADAVDAENRAVIVKAKPSLELVANSLKGEQLAALAAEYQTAAPLHAGALQVNAKGEDQFSKYAGAE